jgi:hypothetical protein
MPVRTLAASCNANEMLGCCLTIGRAHPVSTFRLGSIQGDIRPFEQNIGGLAWCPSAYAIIPAPYRADDSAKG